MSDTPIDLTAERNKRVAPSPEFTKKDDFGRPMFLFLLSYTFDGGQWSTELWAYSHEDAEAKVAGMRESLTVDGQVFSEILA